MSVSGVGNNSNLAAIQEAQRQAELARERAEAARRAAEAAREAARRAAEAAAEQAKAAATARAKADAAQKALLAQKSAGQSGSKVDKAGKDLARLQASAAAAQQKADADAAKAKSLQDTAGHAQTTLDRVEEQVVLQSKDAQNQMRAANAAAVAAKQAPAFSEELVDTIGPTVAEVRDGFDGAQAQRREEMAQMLGFQPTTDPAKIATGLAGDKQYASLAQDPATQKKATDLGIHSASDLVAFGQHLAQLALESGPRRAVDNPARSSDPAALAKVIQAAGETLSGKGKDALTDPTFASLVAQGNDPARVAAGGADLAKMIYASQIKDVVGKPTQDWTPVDAGKFTDAVADQLEAHKGDPNFQRALMTCAGAGLERTAELTGQYTDDKGDRGDIEGMTRGLSRVGNAAPDDARAQLAMGVASKVHNDGELQYVDDGLRKFTDDGGPDAFRKMLGAALQQQGRGDAAKNLMSDGGGGGINLNPLHYVEEGFDALKGLGGDALHALQSAGGKVLKAGESAWDFGVDTSRDVINKGVDLANQGFQAAGDASRGIRDVTLQGIDKALQGAQALAPDSVDGVLDKARDLVGVARQELKVENQVQEGLGGAATKLVQGLNDLRASALKDPVGTTKETIQTLDATINALQLDDRIGKLGEGDSYKMQARLEGSVLGVDGQLQGTMTVTLTPDGKYTMAVDGQIGAGVAARMGTQGVGAGGEASLTANVGATVEFKFNSTHEAAEAARTLMGPVGGAMSGLVDEGPKGAIDGAIPHFDLLKPTAIEVHGGAAGKLAGTLGFKGLEGPGLSGEVSASATLSARVEFPQDGGQPQIVLKQSANVAMKGSAQAMPGVSASAGGTVTVAMEERFVVPKGFNASDLVTDPEGSLKKIDAQLEKGKATLSLSGSAMAQANAGSTLGGQVNAQLKLTGQIGDITGSGAIQAALKGDMGGALDRLSGKVTVSGGVRTSTVQGPDVNFGVGDGADSVEVGLTAQTTDVNPELLSFDNLSLSEARDDLKSFLRRENLSIPLLG